MSMSARCICNIIRFVCLYLTNDASELKYIPSVYCAVKYNCKKKHYKQLHYSPIINSSLSTHSRLFERGRQCYEGDQPVGIIILHSIYLVPCGSPRYARGCARAAAPPSRDVTSALIHSPLIHKTLRHLCHNHQRNTNLAYSTLKLRLWFLKMVILFEMAIKKVALRFFSLC